MNHTFKRRINIVFTNFSVVYVYPGDQKKQHFAYRRYTAAAARPEGGNASDLQWSGTRLESRQWHQRT
jgi:hypothetical protein